MKGVAHRVTSKGFHDKISNNQAEVKIYIKIMNFNVTNEKES